ncbi:MAG: hypothetical protein ACOYI7_01420 [Candidatus Excrementavichristensenella sp.]|jgi:hypothetical protein
MKKSTTLLIGILVLCILSSSFALAEEDPRLALSMEMIHGVHELANDEQYFQFTGFMEHNDGMNFIAPLAETDCSDLRQAYSVRFPAVDMMMLLAGTNMSKPGKTKCKLSVYHVDSLWNGFKSPAAISQSTFLSWSRSYAAPVDFQDSTWIMDCGGAVYCVTFLETGEGIITATAAPMFLDDGETIESIKDFIRERLPFAVFEPIKRPKP